MSPDSDPRLRATQGASVSADLGLQLIVSLCAVIRMARAYDSGNQAYKVQLVNFADSLRSHFDKSGNAILAVVDNELYLNGTRIAFTAFGFPFQRTAVECFKHAEIDGLRVSGTADPAELGHFFRLLLDPDGPRGVDFVKACRAAGLTRTQAALYRSNQDDAQGGEPSPASNHGSNDGLCRTLHGFAASRCAHARIAEVQASVQSLLGPTMLAAPLELRHAKRIVQPLVDATTSSEPLLVGLSVLHRHERDVYEHVVDVATVAVTIGQSIGLDRSTLADLGVAALFHDIGMRVIEKQLRHPPASMTKEERGLLRQHTIEGVKLLAATTTLNQTSLRSMRVALEHHVLAGGLGYPALPGDWRPSVLSRIVSIADCYVSLLGRPTQEGQRTTPSMALGMLLGPLQNRFDAPLLRALVEAMGFYPPGQLVELNDGSLALAIAPNPGDLARPHVVVLTDGSRRPLAPGNCSMLRPLPQPLSVSRAAASEKLPCARSSSEDPPATRAA